MHDLENFIAEAAILNDSVLDRLIPKPGVEPKKLHEAIRWSIFAGGKRIRPAILVAVGQTFGAGTARLLRSAAAVEMIHAYSLIHDDLPAMDDDDLRRGKAACHIQFGEATAVLAGDVLQTLAFQAIADDGSLDAETRIKLISLLAAASGTPSGMVAGQQLDLDAEGRELTINEIARIHSQKTGALISASALAGAVIGAATENELAAVKQYGENIGLLFQITDDLLDITQATTTLGKTAGKDLASKKATYPSHFGIDKTRELAASIRLAAVDVLDTIDKDTVRLRQIADFVFARTN